MAYQVTTGRFVGRTSELARLHQLLGRAAGGEPLLVLLGGEAGVGKTRLVEQLVEEPLQTRQPRTPAELAAQVTGAHGVNHYRLPAAPLLHAIQQRARQRRQSLRELLGPELLGTYSNSHTSGGISLVTLERFCDEVLGWHPAWSTARPTTRQLSRPHQMTLPPRGVRVDVCPHRCK